MKEKLSAPVPGSSGIEVTVRFENGGRLIAEDLVLIEAIPNGVQFSPRVRLPAFPTGSVG